jgi:lipopolysaccharide/colanic/teichoic acid biosynthesis glycosyltransferase
MAVRVKRCLDVAGAAVGLVVLSPVLAGIALALRVTQGSPVLYRQRRPGLHARTFTLLKFRTMRAPRPGEVWFRSEADRLTPLGRFLRTSSLDELPELWNVLRGEMSLVGPRPLLPEYLEAYTAEERRRHDVRPGLTGWAAVNGRNASPFRERLALDVWYVEHWSLALDLEILALTLLRVMRREGAAAFEDSKALGFPIERLHAAGPGAARGGPRAAGVGSRAPFDRLGTAGRSGTPRGNAR